MKNRLSLLALLMLPALWSSAKNETFDNCGDRMYAQDVTLKAGEMTTLALTLDKKHERATDFTNMWFDITFPQDANGKALRPCLDEDGIFDWSGDDIKMVGKPQTPCVSFYNNYDVDSNFPTYRVVGFNIYQIANTANPCQLYYVNIKADEGMLTGDYEVLVSEIIYTNYDDDTFNTLEPQVLCTVHVEGGENPPIEGKASITTGDIALNAGEGTALELMFSHEDTPDFISVEFDIEFPEGLIPVKDEYDSYGYAGEDIPLSTDRYKAPVLQFVDNMGSDSILPVYHVTGINATKTAITANPCRFYTLNVAAVASAPSGVQTLRVKNIVYTTSDGREIAVPQTQEVCIITINNDAPIDYTDIDQLDYAIYLDSEGVRARKNKQCSLKVNMKNAAAVTLWQADMVLPKGFTIAENEWGDPAIEISGTRTNSNRHGIAFNSLADGSMRIVCSSSNNNNFLDNDGEVATITVNVPAGVVDGDYPVTFKNILLVEGNETGHAVPLVVSKVSVKNYTLGDVNDDGDINGIDLVCLTNFILERPSEGSIFEAADVNMDGVINGSDYVRLVNAILGRIDLNAAPARKASAMAGSDLGYAIGIADLTCEAGSVIELPVIISNDAAFTAWQADVELPSILSAEGIAVSGSRTTGNRHGIAAAELASGDLRVLCASTANSDFAGNDGEAAMMKFKVSESAQPGTYTIRIKNGMCIEGNETAHATQDSYVTLTVGTSGINDITVSDALVNVYNASGQLIKKSVAASEATSGLSQGIYMVGNKKILVK